ncbi:hypothetical protein AMAG_10528 [Allomyces macrogynus ATCC 38327]|uniref:ditrans,polycis-polyprenyl diphosphate synthase [(2E,6E)-farnesyldiphosphate specific] n=1 Tax=Allomyces macrogynus (strain ATCC 38327) TaxID=578462 RepID=A0A0L0SUV6_ALLM3|nr:hypothetical protein AMAG_10528 [Allomyces macrogynus ATCC 38327]|eukprot:KNE66302.1 hypothetical protein AMAG_10528 [Allomyces macrogynus ATCC 38327]
MANAAAIATLLDHASPARAVKVAAESAHAQARPAASLPRVVLAVPTTPQTGSADPVRVAANVTSMPSVSPSTADRAAVPCEHAKDHVVPDANHALDSSTKPLLDRPTPTTARSSWSAQIGTALLTVLLAVALALHWLVAVSIPHLVRGAKSLAQWWLVASHRPTTGWRAWLAGLPTLGRTYATVPRHLAIIAPTWATDAWGPCAPWRLLWRGFAAIGVVPTPERQVAVAVATAVTALSNDELVSVSVLLTPGSDRGRAVTELSRAYADLAARSPSARVWRITSPHTDIPDVRLAAPTPSFSSTTTDLAVYILDPAIHGKALIARHVRLPSTTDGTLPLVTAIPDPDLVLIPTAALQLLGYPPWSLRVSELYHEQAGGGGCALTPAFVHRALQRLQKVEQRFGK